MNRYLLGYDIGSSSVKIALVDANTKSKVGIVHTPSTSMKMIAHHPGWAEQHPEDWWKYVVEGTNKILKETQVPPGNIAGIGISYQMHGMVLLDQHQKVLRPAIIWCDSRATELGHNAQQVLGKEYCLDHYLNTPGNFTASKLKWVIDNEPQIYEKVRWLMWPGDYIAMKLTGEVNTTASALSEGILWDYRDHTPAQRLMDYYGIRPRILPDRVPEVGLQGALSNSASAELGIPSGIPLGYRSGDQPNNAMSLNVLDPGEVAATAGTSGVVYAVTDQLISDPFQRINSFVHVNHLAGQKNRIGILLCINGAGIMHNWLKSQIGQELDTFSDFEKRAARITIGSDGLVTLPFGNGAERMLQNQNPGATLVGIQLNRHTRDHLFRSGLEGVAFSFAYGLELLNEMGIDTHLIKAGNDNMFQSAIFSQSISNATGSEIEIVDTTGALGAALASGVSAGLYADLRTAMRADKKVTSWNPNDQKEETRAAYEHWKKTLIHHLNKLK